MANEQHEPNTEMVAWGMTTVGPYRAIVYREMNTEAANLLMEYLAEEAACHSDDCPWWHDWHACNCGAFDKPNA